MEPRPSTGKRGFLNPRKVRALAFWTTVACILVSSVACILAIWEFAEQDVLWRTVATCLVVAGGVLAFAWVNQLFGEASR